MMTRNGNCVTEFERMNQNMGDGEIELSDSVRLLHPNSTSSYEDSVSIDSFVDDLLKNSRTCTHTHSCNPPGPDEVHTHTCFHTHTQFFQPEEEDLATGQSHSSLKSKRPLGNREAVRKYREKKKAHTAHLEEEVEKLRLLNQQLVWKLQGQAILEAEVVRLRSLLVDVRWKIDSELGVFPFEKQCNSSTGFKEGDYVVLPSIDGGIGLRCDGKLRRFHPNEGPIIQGGIRGTETEGNCQAAIVDCHENPNDTAIVEIF